METFLSNAWAWLLGGASAFLLLSNASKRIVEVVQAAKAPNAEQNRQIKELQEWRKEVDRKLANDKVALDGIRDGNHAMYKALLALLDHGIDGNNIKQMEDAKSELYTHLTNK